jgi:hypothetical protein
MKNSGLLSEEKILNRIYVIRGKKVMLDRDLAEMYGVVTGHLNRAVKRNLRRFPDDFMFQLTAEEFENLKCQSGISSSGKDSNLISQSVTSNSKVQNPSLKYQIGTSSLECQSGIPNDKMKSKKGGAWSLPYVFTEQGVAMLSSVLNSDTAIDVNIQIIRVFTRIREVLLSQKDVVLKIVPKGSLWEKTGKESVGTEFKSGSA